MRLTPEVRIRRVVIEPQKDLYDTSTVPDMKPYEQSNAHIHVDDEGYTHVTWLKMVPGWRAELYSWFYASLRAGLFFIMLVYFWSFGGAILGAMGVI